MMMMNDDELPCFKCEHPDAWKARKEVLDVIHALMHGDTPRAPQRNGVLPDACCRRKPQPVN
jgi:hypothetical protein